MFKSLLNLHFFTNFDRQYLHFQYLFSAISFKFLSLVSFILLNEDFYFMGQQGKKRGIMGQQELWPAPYVKNDKLMITFFPEPYFSGFLICITTNGSGVSFGKVANLLEFIPNPMTA